MKKTIRLNNSKSESGQSLVELAIAMVLLLTMFAGIVDLGRIFFHFIEMRDAAEEAMVYGSAFPTHCDQIVERANSSLIDPSNISVAVTMDGIACSSATMSANACTGKEIRVEVEDPNFPITMPFLGIILGRQTVSLDAGISGTILRPACTAGP